MHLKSLTLKGFKSFASATTLKFEPGICAVVGPNGSGKSNVVDALAWVMGEQGAKSLRGSTMQDVIFAGAGSRGPLGRAEVTLTIDNHDGRLPIDYAEVSVTRRMFRDGASEYEINGSRARLVDVRELLSDTGIGREMHIIVGQGKLAETLASRPEERRAYIEEAAGVLKHRRRKEKALRKLASMETNLDRLHDLTDELSRQLGPLARQAEVAKRAATVQAEAREARLALAGYQVSHARAQRATAQERWEAASASLSEAESKLQELATQRVQTEADAKKAAPAFDQAQQLWFRLSTLAERVTATVRVAGERARADAPQDSYQGPDPDELEQRASAADAEREQLLARNAEAQARLEAITEELDAAEEAFREAEAEHMAQVRAVADAREGAARLIAAREAQERRLAELTEQLAETRQRVAQAQARAEASATEHESAQKHTADARDDREPLARSLEDARTEQEAAEARLEVLRNEETERSGGLYRLEARIEALAATAPGQAAGEYLKDARPLAEFVKPEPKVARALTVALGSHAEALVSADIEQAVGMFSQHELARTTLIAVGSDAPAWRITADLPQGASWLIDHVRVAGPVRAAVTRLIADVVLVSDAGAAQAVVTSDPRLRAVTLAGELFGEGWAELGKTTPGSVEIAGDLAVANRELDDARARREELAGTLEGAKRAAEDARVATARAQAAVHEHDAAAQRAQDELARGARRAEADRADCEEAQRLERATRERLEAAEDQLAATKDQIARLSTGEQPAEPTTEIRDEAQATVEQLRAMQVEARLAARSAEDRAGRSSGEGDRLRRQARNEREARARHERARRTRAARQRLAATVQTQAERVLERAHRALEVAQQERVQAQKVREETETRLREAQGAEHDQRARREKAAAAAHQAELQLEKARVRAEETSQQVSEELGIPLRELLDKHAPDADFDPAAWRTKLNDAEKALNSLGKVNPLALEEYQALQERHSFLAAQLADVETARDDLMRVVRDVDDHILKLFTEAWHDVEAEFPRVFSTLFPGGDGKLELTDPDDMLTTGIELHARPPGKKVGRLSLLSGGEKSLTALALLVAIFRARPSPFYVLDEVEAALDDVNLRRLINLLQELRQDSQLIVITHQKATMDIANVLYGVTMRGDGVTRVISQRLRPAETEDVG